MLVPRSTAWLQPVMAFRGLLFRSVNIVCAQLARTSVLCPSNDSWLFIMILSTLSLTPLVNPRTAGGGSTTEHQDFILMTSSADLDWFKLWFSPILRCVNFNLTSLQMFNAGIIVTCHVQTLSWRWLAKVDGGLSVSLRRKPDGWTLNNACCYYFLVGELHLEGCEIRVLLEVALSWVIDVVLQLQWHILL